MVAVAAVDAVADTVVAVAAVAVVVAAIVTEPPVQGFFKARIATGPHFFWLRPFGGFRDVAVPETQPIDQ